MSIKEIQKCIDDNVAFCYIIFMMKIKDICKKRGDLIHLAKQLGLSHVTLLRWKRIPYKRLADVSKVTGIPVDELRPDLAKIFKKG